MASVDLMKHNVVIVLLLHLAIVIALSSADEAKSNGKAQQQQQNISYNNNNTPLSSSSINESKQQNKRLAFFSGGQNTLNSGFKPITSSYPAVSSFLANNNHQFHHQQQPYSSAFTSSHIKYPYGGSISQQYVSPSNVKYSLSSAPSLQYNRAPPLSYGYNNYNNYNSYQPQLAFAASQSQPISYIQSPFQLAQQILAHNYNLHQVAPLIHTPSIGLVGTYQTPANTHNFQNQYAFNKYPSSYSPSTYYQHQQQQQQPQIPKHQQQQQQLITSKPTALETPLATSSSSSSAEVHHNQHGAVSYSTFLQPSFKSHSPPSLPSAAALIATPPPSQHVYYQQQQPQTILDYNKHLSSAFSLPIANYYGGYNAQPSQYQPYAHISKISVVPTPVLPTPQVVSVSVVPTIPQKISLH